jgi:hypothetical protein
MQSLYFRALCNELAALSCSVLPSLGGRNAGYVGLTLGQTNFSL